MIEPGTGDYEAARKVWNGLVDRRPALIAQCADVTAWTRDFFDAVAPYATGRAYINFMGNEGQERVRAAYGEAKYARLARLKAHWDAGNLFHMNQNIVPAP